MTYKITVLMNAEIFPYIDADEEIPCYKCYESLAQMKESLGKELADMYNKVQNITMKEIKKGIQL